MEELAVLLSLWYLAQIELNRETSRMDSHARYPVAVSTMKREREGSENRPASIKRKAGYSGVCVL